jgi:putative hydrolase of the HAD superfamily
MERTPAGITTLLFDMDNTLFDLVGAQIASCHEVARYLGQDDGDALFNYFLRPVHGFEDHENILDYMLDRKIREMDLYAGARRTYEQEKLRHLAVYDGVAETLQELKGEGYRMAIVTDAYSVNATLRMERKGLLPFFDGMVTHDMTGAKKPAPEPFLFALDMMRAARQETVFIGDSPRRDIGPCRDLGITTVYARYGDRFTQDRDGVRADFAIDEIRSLPGIVSGLMQVRNTKELSL